MTSRHPPDESSDGPRGESSEERLDRNLSELLQELRVALPGVQILFAFLLAVPFQANFNRVTEFQRSVYFVTLLLTAISTALMISPTAFHRITFRRQRKEQLMVTANRFTLAGLAFLALAMTGAVMLITDLFYDTVVTICASAFILTLLVVLWWAIPAANRGD